MKKIFLILLLLPIFGNAQLSSEVLEQKIILDTKVKTSKNYLMISAGVTTLGFISTAGDNINVLGFGAAIAGVFTTPYHLTRHLVYVHKRNKFYKKHNIQKKQHGVQR
jgi:hypothetical protein